VGGTVRRQYIYIFLRKHPVYGDVGNNFFIGRSFVVFSIFLHTYGLPEIHGKYVSDLIRSVHSNGMKSCA
jgi:hypothetical protein